MQINGAGVMLAEPQGGAPLVATRPTTLEQVTPTDYSYSAASPLGEKIHAWEKLTKGFGLKLQETFQDGAYWYALGVDYSTGVGLKGPDITSLTPSTRDSTNGISHLFEIGGAVYALNGRYALKRDSDNAWSVSKDFGSGKAALDVVVFKSNASGATEYAYVAMGETEPLWRFDGTTWTQRTEEQTFAISGTPTGGTYTLTYNGNTTAALAYNADAATVQAALRLLTGLSAVTVSSTGVSPDYTHTIVFVGVTGNPPQLTSDITSLTGGSPAKAHATAQPVLFARALGVVGKEFYRAHTGNKIAKVDTDADVWLEANWTADEAFFVGDATTTVTRMAVTATGTLLFLCNNGIYTLNPDGTDVQLFPHLKPTPSTENGKHWWAWENDLHVSYGEAHYRIGPDLGLAAIGPDRNPANDAPVRGRITAGIGHSTFHSYAGLWDPDTGNSWLMKYGAWDGTPGEAQRLNVWHGSISQTFSSKKITAMTRSTVGAATDHQRCYLGFSDGTVAWFLLPCTANPRACSSYRFSTTNGELFLPLWHGLWPADPKALRAVTGTGIFSSGTSVTVAYKTDPTLSTYAELTGTIDTIREKLDFPSDTSATLAAVKLIFTNAATTTSPVLMGLGLHHAVRPALVLLYEFAPLAVDGLLNRAGGRIRLGASEIRAVVKAAKEAVGSVTVVLPDESNQQLSFVNYGEQMVWSERLKRWRATLPVQAIQYTLNTTYGTYGRLEAYTYGSLETRSYGEMEAL